MKEVTDIKEVINTASFYQSNDLDLEKNSDELWPALLSCKKFLSKVSCLPPKQYFFKNKLENCWEYFVPRTNNSLQSINDKFRYCIELHSGPNKESKEFLNFVNLKGKPALTLHTDDLKKSNLISKIEKTSKLDNELRKTTTSLTLYLPFILGDWQARHNSSVFVTGHLTQSEDGKIAKKGIDPTWLGGEIDKKHTHRLRSLHQALLIGSRTLQKDNPKLTVRHCRGQNPIPVIFRNNQDIFYDKKLFKSKNRKILLLSKNQKNKLNLKNVLSNVNEINFESNLAVLSPREILNKLKKNDIHSIFIEGGGITISHFLTSNLLNRFHLQVTNKNLVSGINSFTLPVSSSTEQINPLNRIDYKINDQTLIDYSPISS